KDRAGPCGGGGAVPYTHDDAIISIIKWLCRACRARFGPAVKFRCQSPVDPTKFRYRPICSVPGQPSDRQKIFDVSVALFGAEMDFVTALRETHCRLVRRPPSGDRDLRSGACAVGADLPWEARSQRQLRCPGAELGARPLGPSRSELSSADRRSPLRPA